jgi:4-amino-4-deoxy-L-arabinose transferase-like glycosyltransferase
MTTNASAESFLRMRHLLIIAIVALAVRFIPFNNYYLIGGGDGKLLCGGDPATYMAMAAYVYTGGDLSSNLFLPRPPAFPVIAALIYHFTGENILYPVLLNLILNVLTCLIIYQVARLASLPARAALFSGLLAALYPAMVSAATCYMTDSMLLFFAALAFLLYGRWLVGLQDGHFQWHNLLLGTACLTCGNLARSALLLWPAALVILLLLLPIFAKAARMALPKRLLAIALVLILASPSFVIPTVRNIRYSNIATFSTAGQWMLLFMRATSSERRATNAPVEEIYARFMQEIEQRAGNPIPPLSALTPDRIWDYYLPTPAQHQAISQLAVEKNLRYPQWYLLNTFYGLYLITTRSADYDLYPFLPAVVSDLLHGLFVLLALVGAWRFWRAGRGLWAWLLLLGSAVILVIGVTVALQTAVLDTRHGLAAALMMFVLAGAAIAKPVQPTASPTVKAM